MNKYFVIYLEGTGDNGAPTYHVDRLEAESLTAALGASIYSEPVLAVIEPHKFERVMASLTFPPNPVHYHWAYLTHQQTFRGMGNHPDPDGAELQAQAIADYGDGIAQDVLILNANQALQFLRDATAEWGYHLEGREV